MTHIKKQIYILKCIMNTLLIQQISNDDNQHREVKQLHTIQKTGM